jgi:signal transduction histidine kinase
MMRIRWFIRRLKRCCWDIALAACVCVALCILTASELGHRQLAREYQRGTQAVWLGGQLHELSEGLDAAENGGRGFLLTLSSEYMARYRHATATIYRSLDQLRATYADHPDWDSGRRFVVLASAMLTRLDAMTAALRDSDISSFDQATGMSEDNGRERSADQIRLLLKDLAAREETVVSDTSRDWRRILDMSRFGIDGATALTIVLLTLLFVVMRQDWRRANERRSRLDRIVRERTRQLADLASRLQEAGEAEKAAMARELHDEFGSLLTAGKMDLAWARRQLGPEHAKVSAKLDDVMALLDQGLLAKSRIVEGLRPSVLEYFGICAAARDLCEQVAARAGWRLTLELPEVDPVVEPGGEIVLYRVLQESLTNAARYARATQVRMTLRCEPTGCALEVSDNGTGFRVADAKVKAQGIFGMRHRVEAHRGKFHIHSVPGEGTVIRAALPVRRTASAVRDEQSNAASPIDLEPVAQV